MDALDVVVAAIPREPPVETFFEEFTELCLSLVGTFRFVRTPEEVERRLVPLFRFKAEQLWHRHHNPSELYQAKLLVNYFSSTVRALMSAGKLPHLYDISLIDYEGAFLFVVTPLMSPSKLQVVIKLNAEPTLGQLDYLYDSALSAFRD